MCNEKLKKKIFSNETILCECPYCGDITEISEPTSWKNFFQYGVEEGFWDIIGFAIKWVIIMIIIGQVLTRTILIVLSDPEYKNILEWAINQN